MIGPCLKKERQIQGAKLWWVSLVLCLNPSHCSLRSDVVMPRCDGPWVPTSHSCLSLSVIAGGPAGFTAWTWLTCLSGTWEPSRDSGGGGQELYQVGSVSTRALNLLSPKVRDTYVSWVLVFCLSFHKGLLVLAFGGDRAMSRTHSPHNL